MKYYTREDVTAKLLLEIKKAGGFAKFARQARADRGNVYEAAHMRRHIPRPALQHLKFERVTMYVRMK